MTGGRGERPASSGGERAPKVLAAILSRAAAARAWLSWDRPRGDGKLIWCHAASVGEMLTAAPVLARVRRHRPRTTIVLSHTSPSVERWPRPVEADRVGYLPLTPGSVMREVMDHIRPDLLVFARGDVWAGLARAAHARRVPLTMLGAEVSPGSTRLLGGARQWLRDAYADMRWAGAVSQPDADRLMALGVDARAIEVTGDPRHDQVLERLTDLTLVRQTLAWAGDDHVLVAGSTDRDDEHALLSAFAILRRERPAGRLVLVPHEPGPKPLRHVADAARKLDLEWCTGDAPSATAGVMVMAALGRLGDLYGAGSVAYVGGGFSRAGLHSVAEPAAYGVPVLFGDRDSGTRTPDAGRLLETGGGVAVPPGQAAVTIAAWWQRWLDDPVQRQRSGLAARAILREGAGERSARALLRFC